MVMNIEQQRNQILNVSISSIVLNSRTCLLYSHLTDTLAHF